MTIPDDLQGDQPDAYKSIVPDLFDFSGSSTLRALRGYAGTGKTYLMGRIAEKAAEEDVPLYVMAPTHQSKRVMGSHLPERARHVADIRTIHSFLGLKLSPNQKDGGYTVDQNRPLWERGLDARHDKALVVVDEASWLNQHIESYLQDEIDKNIANFLFVGDPMQLPPPTGAPSGLIESEGYTMTSVIRQGSTNPIIDVATRIRNGNPWQDVTAFYNDQGVFVTESSRSFLQSAARQINAHDSPRSACVLAGRNRTVRDINDQLKSRLHPKAPEWTEGMLARVQAPWGKDDDRIEVQNADLLRVESAWQTQQTVSGVVLPVWKLDTRNVDTDNRVTIWVLAEEGRPKYEDELGGRLDVARDTGDARDWGHFYELKEGLCEVRYAYASTVHKSQGSTFDTVYIDERDLRGFPGGEELQRRLYYVAFTRAARRVCVLT